jgi:hypothetical protein
LIGIRHLEWLLRNDYLWLASVLKNHRHQRVNVQMLYKPFTNTRAAAKTGYI